MSNKAHGHLHRLIRSMTPAEKRYFKLFASRHVKWGHGNQKLLFDAIGAMDIYDEAALLARHKGAGFTRSFSIAKRRLYETVLNSLEAFHADSSVDARLRRMLHQVEILHRRALYEEARRMLTSVRKLARAHDRRSVLYEVLAWERRWMERAGYSGVKEPDLQRMAEEATALDIGMREMDQLWGIKSRIFLLLYREGRIRDASHAHVVHELSAHPLLQDVGPLHSARARFLFHHIHSALAYAQDDLSSCEQHLVAAHALLLRDRVHFSDEPNLLFSVLSNRIHACTRLGRYRQASQLLKEFRRLPAMTDPLASPDMEVKIFATATSLELDLFIQRGAFEQALARLPEVEAGLTRHEPLLNAVRKEGLFFQFACVHFGAGQFSRAHHWTHRLLNEKGGGRNGELQIQGRLLELLILLELGKRDLLPYALRNTKRFLFRRRHLHKAGRPFLAFVREHLAARGTAATRIALEHFRDAMIVAGGAPEVRSLFEHIDVPAWIESRLSGRSFAQVVGERARRMSEAA